MKRTDANDTVTDVATLRACVGKLSVPRDLKVINYLDEHAQRWIATSPFLFAAFGNGLGVRITAAGGKAGFVRVPDVRPHRSGSGRNPWPIERAPAMGLQEESLLRKRGTRRPLV